MKGIRDEINLAWCKKTDMGGDNELHLDKKRDKGFCLGGYTYAGQGQSVVGT